MEECLPLMMTACCDGKLVGSCVCWLVYPYGTIQIATPIIPGNVEIAGYPWSNPLKLPFHHRHGTAKHITMIPPLFWRSASMFDRHSSKRPGGGLGPTTPDTTRNREAVGGEWWLAYKQHELTVKLVDAGDDG